MSLHATFIEHTFVSILALYVTLECAVTILQTRAAEKSCGRVPEGFEKKLTLAGIRKAADYTGELAQANLLLTVVGAGFALCMTFGNGLNVFTAVIETIMGPGIPADWVLISLIVLLMLLIELPFGWWARYRVKERYGYMREPRMRWLSRTLSEALWGWLVFMPVSAALLTIFEYAGGDWWKLAWGVWLVYLLWRWKLSSVYGVFWKRRSRPYANAETREAVRESLHRQGITMTEMVVMTRPASWDHSNIVLSGWGLRRRVIVFAHVAHQLRKDEIVALAAHEAAHVRHFHGVLRLLINVAVSYIFCWLAGWGATHVQFFEGFNYSPMLTLDMPGTHAGSVCAVALVVFPMLLYPLSPLLNLAARLMQYDADLHAAHRGTRPDDQRPREAAQGHDDISLAVPRLFALSLQASAPRHARCEPAAPQAPFGARRPARAPLSEARRAPSARSGLNYLTSNLSSRLTSAHEPQLLSHGQNSVPQAPSDRRSCRPPHHRPRHRRPRPPLLRDDGGRRRA